MLKVFFVGDFTSNTGPANVNKLLIKGLEEERITYTESKYKVTRIIELIYKILSSNCVCFCSYSKLNFLGIRIAKLLNKKTFYLMHGYKTYEEKINNPRISSEQLKRINRKEKVLLKSVDRIFCVSKRFMDFMKEAEPECADKFDYNHNPIDLEQIDDKIQGYGNYKKSKKKIVSIGGGMKRKNNLEVCRAIDKLNREKGLDLEYIVIGPPYTDKDKICSYNFVTYYDQVSYEDVLKILSESFLYIQNSSFETFGLAVIEALLCNCNLLVSSSVGSTGVLSNITTEDLIYDVKNKDEIANKIELILSNDNYYRLQEGLNHNEIDYKISTRNLLEKITNF